LEMPRPAETWNKGPHQPVRLMSFYRRAPRDKSTTSVNEQQSARSASLSKEIAMTMPNIIPSHSTAAPAIRRGIGFPLVRLGRLVDRWVSAAIARHERRAALFALRQLSDRELRDMGSTAVTSVWV
jgi:uncharacterized protein YjiS (DUF1127 family)